MSQAPSENSSSDSSQERVDSARARYRAAVNNLMNALQVLRKALFVLVPFLRQTPRGLLAGIAVAIFALVAWWEARTPSVPWDTASGYLLHWRTPRKLYDERTLPAFDGAVIESVEISPDGKRVWIAGDAGLLAFTEDEGKTWTQFVYDPAKNTMVKKEAVQSATLTSSLTHWTVEAAQSASRPPAGSNQQQQRPIQQQQQQQNQAQYEKGSRPNPRTGLNATIQSTTTPSTAAQTKRRPAARARENPVTPTGPSLRASPLKIPPDWREVHFRNSSMGWVRDADNYALATEDSGATWLLASSDKGVTNSGRGLRHEYSISSAILQFEKEGLGLRDLVFRADGKTGFAVGTKGAVFRTRDGGLHWDAVTLGAYKPDKVSADYGWWQQPVRVFAPLSMLQILFGLFLLLPAVLPEEVKGNVERSIANITVSDAPVISETEDTLGFGAVARAISGLLRNRSTKLPITLAITAKWGRGKTSLMSMVQQDLKAAGWRTVWFNAWHHQEELSLLAALLQTVRRKAPPQMLERGGVQYRLRLIASRLLRWRTLWVIAGCMVLFQAESAVHEKHQSMYGCAAQYLYEQSGGVVSANENVCKTDSKTTASTTPTGAKETKKVSEGSTKDDSSKAATAENKPQANAQATMTPKAGAAVGGGEKNKTSPESTPASTGAEGEKKEKSKPGILEFLMKLLFDMARQTERFEASPLPGVHIIPLLALSAFVIVLGWQVMQSFGANPAELLTAQTAHRTVSELEARTNFLEEFRKQYGDVVEALGKYRLVILIDDLDRCRPEKISEMLEASNYLMAAGKCAIVMALEEQAVMAGLGLSFQRMAEEMVDLPDGQPLKGDFLAETRYKRKEFARNYVEKLLNVVVQVPVIDANRFGNSLAGGTVRKETLEQRRTRRWRRFASVGKVPAAAVIVLGGAFTIGAFLNEELNKPEVKKTVETSTAPQNAPTPQPTASTAETAGKTTAASATDKPRSESRSSKETAFLYVPARVPIPQRWFTTWPQRASWLVLFLAFVATLLARRPPPVTEDSREFTQALRLWMPMLAELNPSLRFGKRVLNRLRYLAMLERESEKDAGDAAGAKEKSKQVRIPQTLLVALGAMDATKPEVLQSAPAFAEYLRALEQPVTSVTGPAPRDRLTWQAHQSFFEKNTPAELEQFRQRFLNLSAGITAA